MSQIVLLWAFPMYFLYYQFLYAHYGLHGHISDLYSHYGYYYHILISFCTCHADILSLFWTMCVCVLYIVIGPFRNLIYCYMWLLKMTNVSNCIKSSLLYLYIYINQWILLLLLWFGCDWFSSVILKMSFTTKFHSFGNSLVLKHSNNSVLYSSSTIFCNYNLVIMGMV